jgi:hypothetical protein
MEDRTILGDLGSSVVSLIELESAILEGCVCLLEFEEPLLGMSAENICG